MECFKKIAGTLAFVLLSTVSIAQLTQGSITFERRTNLKKTVGDNPRVSRFLNDDNKIRKENFELKFNETSSVFKHIENEDEEDIGMMKYFTQRNTVYQDLDNNGFMVILNSWGQPMYLQDSMSIRLWKVTESKRKFAGYMCYKSIWEMNDSTRIYAWFCPDIVPSVGPEGFSGLPGAILGLATEDGGVVYYATEVKEMEVTAETTDFTEYMDETYTKEELKEILLKNMGKWIKKKDLDAMFAWY
ncbi:MAG: GLPGLI family protein [Crocinitomicaceae bacterium]|jgi:GLPGLI family protein|nr:GLPGLI family protein [Crocinitomicaceae bacterium]